jgi:hypothetical protein
MKRGLLAIPLLILLLFSACGDIAGQVSMKEGTMVAETQTATVWTPTPIPTVDPNEPRILEWVNAGLPSDGLETTLDARYMAVDTYFPYIPNSSFRAFRLEILCECAINSHCCVPEHMFVLTLQAMKTRGDKIIEQVAGDVIRVDVICFNRSGRIGAFSAGWSDVRDYLVDGIDGRTLAWRVTPNAAP